MKAHLTQKLFALALAVALGANSRTQSAPAKTYRFEEATIKPSSPDDPNSNLNLNSGHVSAENVSLIFLLQEAFGLSSGSDDQILHAPAWARSARFDIRTTESDDTAKQVEALSPERQSGAIAEMLRSLLEDRFELKAHIDIQPRNVLALVAEPGGLKLQKFVNCSAPDATPTCVTPKWRGLHNGGGHIDAVDATLAMLANVLSLQPAVGGRMVVDDTHLNGRYNFDLHFQPADAPVDGSGPSLFSALREQTGLALVKKTLPVRVLVIEQLNKPTPN